MSITATELKMNPGKIPAACRKRVIVDVLQKREPFYKSAMDIVLAVSTKRCLGDLTGKSVTDVNIHKRNNFSLIQLVQPLKT